MKLVMTLLVRDEADIVDAQVAFHLHAGVDFVIATDNRSQDGTTEVLERYEREGRLHLIREPGEDLRQSEWVTRMARLAATELRRRLGAERRRGRVLVAAAERDSRTLLAPVPARYGVVAAAWRNFVPRPDGHAFFAERMTARLCTPAFHAHPLSTHSKSAHRAVPDVRIGRGNHEAFGDRARTRSGGGTRSRSSTSPCARSSTACGSTSRSSSRSSATPRRASRVTWPTPTAPIAPGVSRSSTPRSSSTTRRSRAGSRTGTLAVDTRLRDALRSLGFGEGEESGAARDRLRDGPA